MLVMRLVSVTKLLSLISILISVLLAGCGSSSNNDEPIKLQMYQQWQLKPGDAVKGFQVLGGLGDISISLNGKSVYAPFDGRAQRDPQNCLIFSSPDVPAYLFRLCGLNDLRLGSHQQGAPLGSASILHFATLRKQPDGTWAIVEPSKPIIERVLSQT